MLPGGGCGQRPTEAWKKELCRKRDTRPTHPLDGCFFHRAAFITQKLPAETFSSACGH